ncbi:MAG: small multi-drug export protein [Oscillospiraceae bacterium]|jgi:uncharacterized membrane protein|nr:small multi-drug export protein [Oscillospiraceae bacterium]
MLGQVIRDLGEWLTGLPPLGQFVMTFFVSMIPIIELRGAIPIAAAAGLPWHLAFIAAVLGNMLPVPFIVVYARRVFKWLKDHNRLAGMVYSLEKRALNKAGSVSKYEIIGLFIFVAIPLPGTGAWTGALIAAMLNMRLKNALISAAAGVVTAAAAVCLLSYGITYGIRAIT